MSIIIKVIKRLLKGDLIRAFARFIGGFFVFGILCTCVTCYASTPFDNTDYPNIPYQSGAVITGKTSNNEDIILVFPLSCKRDTFTYYNSQLCNMSNTSLYCRIKVGDGNWKSATMSRFSTSIYYNENTIRYEYYVNTINYSNCDIENELDSSKEIFNSEYDKLELIVFGIAILLMFNLTLNMIKVFFKND